MFFEATTKDQSFIGGSGISDPSGFVFGRQISSQLARWGIIRKGARLSIGAFPLSYRDPIIQPIKHAKLHVNHFPQSHQDAAMKGDGRLAQKRPLAHRVTGWNIVRIYMLQSR